jgi:hypothetical protein
MPERNRGPGWDGLGKSADAVHAAFLPGHGDVMSEVDTRRDPLAAPSDYGIQAIEPGDLWPIGPTSICQKPSCAISSSRVPSSACLHSPGR